MMTGFDRDAIAFAGAALLALSGIWPDVRKLLKGTRAQQATADAAENPALRLSAEVVELPYGGRSEQTTQPITRTERHAAAPRFGLGS